MALLSWFSVQGGSLARRSVVAELSSNASISGAASNANNKDNDDDDDDFDYEPAKSKRRVSSASTDRGTSPSSGAEVRYHSISVNLSYGDDK